MNSACVACRACGYYLPLSDALKVQDVFFHPEHFCCAMCRCSLFGKPYNKGPGGEFFCKDDFAKINTSAPQISAQELCVNCRKSVYGAHIIAINSKKFHRECFYCSRCKVSLVNKQPFEGKNDVICSVCLSELKSKLNEESRRINEKILESNIAGIVSPGQNLKERAGVGSSGKPEREIGNSGGKEGSSPFLAKLREDILHDKYEDVCKSCGERIAEQDVLKIDRNSFHSKCIAQKKKNPMAFSQMHVAGTMGRPSSEANEAMTPNGDPNRGLFVREGTICEGCQQPMKNGESHVIALNTYVFHEKCLKCNNCCREIGSENIYVTSDLLFLCLPCSEIRKKERLSNPSAANEINAFARQRNEGPSSIKKSGRQEICKKCSKEISADSVKIFGAEYHPDCFCCSRCQKACRSEFFYKNQLCLCSECYKLEANICKACEKPIMKRMYFRYGKYWHPECLEDDLRESNSEQDKELSKNLFSRSSSRLQIITHDESLLRKNESMEVMQQEEVHTPGFPRKRSIDIAEVINSVEINEARYEYRALKKDRGAADDEDLYFGKLEEQGDLTEKLQKIRLDSGVSSENIFDSMSMHSKPFKLEEEEEKKSNE